MANAAQNFRTNALTYAELQSIFTGEEYRPFIEFVSGLLSDLVYSSGLIDENTEDIEDLTVRVDKNEQDISYNFQYLHGSPLYSDGFSEDSDYIEGDFVTFDGNEYIAKVNITAGTFNPSQWRRVSTVDNVEFINKTRQDVSNNFVFARYGGVSLNSATLLADIVPGTWQTLPMDTNELPTPKGIAQDQGSNAISFLSAGVYAVSIYISLVFDDTNSGRTLLIRGYNSTDGVELPQTYSFGVGRNQTSAGISAQVFFDVTSADAGDLISLQISAAEGFTGIENISNKYIAFAVSELPSSL